MKAITRDRYGSPDVLRFQDVPKPVPGDNEVLVRVRAASINPYDWHFLRGKPYFARLAASGLLSPKYPILGSDAAGQVEAVGGGVRRFRPGDEVFGLVEKGGLAEYLSAPESLFALKPAKLTFEQAAAVPLAATTALQGLRDAGHLKPGQKALIIGASGGVGTFAVQIARAFGAEVTGVCSTRNLELVRSIGADHVIDYTREDVTRSGTKYDLVLQLAGTASASDLRRALTPRGTLLLSSGDSSHNVIGPLGRIVVAAVLSRFVSQTLRPFLAKPSSEDLKTLAELIDAGQVRPVIDRTYTLSESPDALRYLELGHARGKVVVTI
jgi:NADPH:quinone reductase-like Zn-dependent oxidoreductase